MKLRPIQVWRNSYKWNATHLLRVHIQPKILRGRAAILVSIKSEIWPNDKQFYIYFSIGRSVIGLLSVAPYSWFEKWSHLEEGKGTVEEYESIKNIIGQNFVNQAAHFYPKIKVNCS